MTVNAAFTETIGALPAFTAGPMLGRAQVAGPYTVSKQLNEAATNGDELTPAQVNPGIWVLTVPADNAAVYAWAASGTPAVTATAAVLINPGTEKPFFVGGGWRIIVKATLP